MRYSYFARVALAAALALGFQSANAYRSSYHALRVAAPVLRLKSNSALVLDQRSGDVLYAKNPQAVVPIASITKLVTAMVVLDAKLDPHEMIRITRDDIDHLRGSHSRLRVGTVLPRDELLRLALMSSENRAASALGRNYPGGEHAFVRAMNAKARQLGMKDSHFAEPTGLSSSDVSTADDLSKLVEAAHKYAKIREYTTTRKFFVHVGRYRIEFRNTNGLVGDGIWKIGLSKTGYISDAGECLVMQATLIGRPTVIVLLDSWGKYTRIGDANRVRKWLEAVSRRMRARNLMRARNGRASLRLSDLAEYR